MRREEVGSHLDVENEYKDKRRGREGGEGGRGGREGRKDREERGRGEGVRDNDKREMRSERRQ